MPRRFKITYQVDQSVQPWMEDSDVVREGETVYEYTGYTYGCTASGSCHSTKPRVSSTKSICACFVSRTSG